MPLKLEKERTGSGVPGRSPAGDVDRSAFKKMRSETVERGRAGINKEKFKIVWELVKHPEFKKQAGLTGASSQDLYNMALQIMDSNTVQEIEQAFSDIQQNKQIFQQGYSFERGQGTTQGPASFNKMKKAIEIAVGAAMNNAAGRPGDGGREKTANLAFSIFTMPDEEVDNLYQQSKASPGTAEYVAPYLPEAPPQPKETKTRNLPDVPPGRFSTEDIMEFAKQR
jgi:hypothetical protein